VRGLPSLVLRSLLGSRRVHAAVVLGVAAAVSVLAGALVVGESVRASLRELAVGRLGRADVAISASRFFRESLAADLLARPRFAAGFEGACPLVALDGIVSVEGGARAGGVRVYGIDERFGAFHGAPGAFALAGREALVGAPLFRELGIAPGGTLLVRVEQPAEIPGASLFGRREDLGRTLRVTLKGVVEGPLGELSLRPQQQSVRAVFLPLRLVQRALKVEGRVNTLLLAARPGSGSVEAAAAALRESASLGDLGLRLRDVPPAGALSLESETALVDDATVELAREAAGAAGLRASAVLTYLANRIRRGDRSVPYSVVTALEDDALLSLGAATPASEPPPIVLGAWAAGDLGAKPGEAILLDYDAWEEEGRLEARSAAFTLAAIAPMQGLAADRDLAPQYPGITESAHLSDWDPPFPIDLSRVRAKDERYWEEYRTTPKAFVPMAVGRKLWGHRLGRATSVRIAGGDGAARDAFARRLRERLDPLRRGFAVESVRRLALEASAGATDFGEYFAYFSAFLVAAAVMLAGLFFRLGVEARLQQVGLFRALGFGVRRIRGLLLAEGLLLAAVGAVLGLLGAWAYASLMLLGLRTWWSDAVGTSALAVHVSARALLAGALGGMASAVLAIAWTLRDVMRIPPRALLHGAILEAGAPGRPRRGVRGLGLTVLALAASLLAAAAARALPEAAAFFAAGALVLAGGLVLLGSWLAGGRIAAGTLGVVGLGLRSASRRPGRSLLTIALIASATFVIVSVGAFRREGGVGPRDRRSGDGGYALVAESLLPLHHDPGSPEGRAAMGLDDPPGALADVSFARFRLRGGDDASCLNLYRPGAPRVLGARAAFLREGRFAFQSSLAQAPAEKANPWLLLEASDASGTIPVVGDANSLAYVLHLKLGDTLRVERPGREPLGLRVVGALRDSLLQSELVMSETAFLRAFPDEGGYRFFLIDVPEARAVAVASLLEARLGDLGLDASPAAERLARFHRVENTYLSTFQMLGALGLVLGTLGLATVLLRNVLERRRELALLRAVGFRESDVTRLVLAENVLLLLLGLGLGAGAALVAVAPALFERGAPVPLLGILGLLLAVFVTGLLASRVAVLGLHQERVLEALRGES